MVVSTTRQVRNRLAICGSFVLLISKKNGSVSLPNARCSTGTPDNMASLILPKRKRKIPPDPLEVVFEERHARFKCAIRKVTTIAGTFSPYHFPFLSKRLMEDDGKHQEEELVLKGRVVVYSISGCPHCKAAKGLLKEWRVPFIEVNLDVYPERREDMIARTSRHTVPQIFFNEVSITNKTKWNNK